MASTSHYRFGTRWKDIPSRRLYQTYLIISSVFPCFSVILLTWCVLNLDSDKVVCGLSLLSSREMFLSEETAADTREDCKNIQEGKELTQQPLKLTLPPRSLYLLFGHSRTHLAHSIPSYSSEPQRKRRLSIIFRDAAPPPWASL